MSERRIEKPGHWCEGLQQAAEAADTAARLDTGYDYTSLFTGTEGWPARQKNGSGDGKFPESFTWDSGAVAEVESSAALHGLADFAAARQAAIDKTLWDEVSPPGTYAGYYSFPEKVPPPPHPGEYHPREQPGFSWITERLAAQQEQETIVENGES